MLYAYADTSSTKLTVQCSKQAGLTFVRLWDAGERGVVEFKL